MTRVLKQIFERCKVIVFLYVAVYIIIHSDKVDIFVGKDKFTILDKSTKG